jgi:predicted DNA-binding protein (MmcQ/YjbR family)
MSNGSNWLTYCLAKPGAWQDEPWEGDVVVKVGDKIFAFLGATNPESSIGLKCGNRDMADTWLSRYPGTAAKMPYIGQHGWNTFALDGAIPTDELSELIDESYDQVVGKLPKGRRPSR